MDNVSSVPCAYLTLRFRHHIVQVKCSSSEPHLRDLHFYNPAKLFARVTFDSTKIHRNNH
jgi:hypothetical protein